jgi:hypothetical protein
MKTNVYFLRIAEFFLEWDMLQTNVEKTKHTFCVQLLIFQTRVVHVT